MTNGQIFFMLVIIAAIFGVLWSAIMDDYKP